MKLLRTIGVVLAGMAFVAVPLQAESQMTKMKKAVAKADSKVDTKATKPNKEKLVKKKLGAIRNVHALGDIYLAGQPTPEDLVILKKQGIKTVITLRKTKEVKWDEAAGVKQQGMKYVQVPFQGVAELTPKVFDDVLKVLRDEDRGPTLFHCGSANRVGAIWYAYRVLDGKLSPAEAMKEAKVVGLRTPGYATKAEAYVLKQQSEAKSEKKQASKKKTPVKESLDGKQK